MTLQYQVDSLDNVPEAVRAEYVEQDGKFILQLEGAKPLTDFENLESAMKKRLGDALAKLEAANQDALSKGDLKAFARDFAREMNAESAGTSGGANEQHVADLERKLAASEEKEVQLTGERDTAINNHRSAARTSAIAAAVADSTPRAEAAEAVVKMAGDYFEVAEDGSVKSKIDCEYGPDLEPKAVIEKMKTDPRWAPFWPPSKGGGADRGGGMGGAGGSDGDKNPWSPEQWNKTEQMAMVQTDAAKAERLAKAAGVPVHATRRQAEDLWARKASHAA